MNMDLSDFFLDLASNKLHGMDIYLGIYKKN